MAEREKKITPFSVALKWLLKEKLEITREELAEKLKIGPGYLSALSTGARQGNNPELRIAIAEYFGMSHDAMLDLGKWLLAGEKGEDWTPPVPRIINLSANIAATSSTSDEVKVLTSYEENAPINFIPVKKAKATLSAGNGNFVIDDRAVDIYYFRSDWLHSVCQPHGAILMDVDGQSMFPTVNHRDTVLIDMMSSEFADDQIFAVGIRDTILIKRLRKSPTGMVKVISDNRDFDDIEVDPEDVRILGRVVWLGMVI